MSMHPEDRDALVASMLGTLLVAGALLLAIFAQGCAWGAQGVVVYQPDGVTKACEAHVRFLVVGTGDTTQTSDACAQYRTTTSDTGFSDNAAVIIPEVVKKIVEGAVAGATGGAPGAAGKAAGVLLDQVGPQPAP